MIFQLIKVFPLDYLFSMKAEELLDPLHVGIFGAERHVEEPRFSLTSSSKGAFE